MRGGLLKALGLCLIATQMPTEVRAQYRDPFYCMAPTGQQMYELAAMNMTRAYREQPSNASKKKMCASHKRAVKVYEKAVAACNRSDCPEESFRQTCESKRSKLLEWKKNAAIACSVR